jgi:hypothetical protein
MNKNQLAENIMP